MANEKTSFPPPYEQSQSFHTSYQHSYTTELQPNHLGFQHSETGFQQGHPGFQHSQTGFQPGHPGIQHSQTGFQPNQTGYQQSHPASPPGFQPSHTEFQQNYPGSPAGHPGIQNHHSYQQNYVGSGGPLPDKAGNPASAASAPAPAQVPLTSVTHHGSSVHYVGPEHSFAPVMMTNAIPLGPSASTVVCPKCKETVTTHTRREASKLAWLGCCILAFVGCFCGCCLIPFCIKQCQIVHHTCPKCKTYLGKYSRLN